ncbi:unnamed protein product [Mytilus edulis]|uniref:Tc1-like transposase DDE domain-containing protein n=1 Tax=Mytilus edulis TaxID=6550 RepID=A0A8S3PVG5_MYTED|nr:unnamed protein product [Mytilus edulis]
MYSIFTERQPSIQLQEIQQKLIDTGICTIENCPGQNSISKSLRNDLLLTRKKIRVVPRESQTAQIETKLDDFINFISTSNANNLYFFDETSFLKTSGNRKYGYALYGHEPIEIQRYASSATLTVNLMHSRSGVAYFNFVEGPSDSLHLLNFFVEVFHQRIYGLPILKPGDIVIMDNCRFHHSRLIQNQLQYLFRVNGVTLRYQPPYHPELNTCEYCFKLIKDGIKRENHYYEEHMELAIYTLINENIEFRQENRGVRDEIRVVKDENRNVKDEIRVVKDENRVVKDEIRNVNNDKRDLEEENMILRDRKTALEEENRRLQQRIAQLEGVPLS